MNPNAIYSKSGKGVQEASGKTSLLSRPDRAVLSAIDGRATLADVAQKVGKTFDPAFEKLIETLDKSGFIRAVSAGAPGAKPAAGKPAPTAPMDAGSDLDFTAAMSAPKGKPPPPPQAPPRAAPAPKKPTVTIPPPPPPPSAEEKAKAERIAKEQQEAFIKAREEAERKAAAERERIKAEAEAKLRTETESKLRTEGEAKAKADAEKKLAAQAEAKVKAAAEAKAKAEAEAKKAREEAERVRKEAEEKARQEAERARKEAEDKARREQEELKRKLEEERKAREEAERKAKEEARRLEEERRKLEEERKRVEAERKRAEEERKREEAERAARKKREEAEEQAAAAAAAAAAGAKAKETQAPQAPGSFSDSLLADLDSFTNKEENEVKEKAEADRKAKEEAERRAREEAERRAKEEAERQEREDKERDKRRQKEDAAARKQAEERELREREEQEKERLREEEEKRKKEAEEREKKAKQEERMSAQASKAGGRAGAEPFSEEEALRRRRERQLGPSKTSAAAAKERIARGGWGKPIAITLFLLLVVGLGVAHIMPLDVSEYRAAAEEALGRPVKIGGARLSMLTGMPELKFSDVVVGETRIAEVRAFPQLDALSGPSKRFSRIEIAGAKVDQEVLGQALFAKAKGDNFTVARITARNIEFVGPLTLPKGLEFDAVYDAEGMVRAATVRGPEALIAKLLRKEGAVEVEMSAASFSVPFAPEISLTKFGLKGTATPRGLSVAEWDGQLLNGTLSGTANVRWGDTWLVDGVLTARNITAAVFAPALLSDGRGEGSGKFSMRGDPGKLAANARLDGSFTITRGVLGTIDLSRAIQTAGKQATGRTQFNEMNGHAVYDRGAVALRNVTLSAGQLNAGASADIAQSGALSGRIVADVKVSSQTLRATLNLGGTVKEPQVR